MVIKHTGRKTGELRYAPVNFVEDGDYVYCTAGFGEQTHWYRNLQANPEVELWLPESRWAGIAEDISNAANRVDLLRQVLIASGFAAVIFGLNPRKMSDREIESLLEHYRLVQITKTEPVTGPGGPGDLAWVWPAATFLLVLRSLKKDRRI